jgi:hypothetical protein
MGAAGSPDSGGSGGVVGRGRCGGGIGAHLSLVCALVWSREAGGDGAQLHRVAASAAAQNPAKLGQQPGGKRRVGLARGLAKGLGCSRGRRGERRGR